MTEPTDAELTAFTDAFDWEGWISPALAKRAFARAVLAKWGAPPAVAGWQLVPKALDANMHAAMDRAFADAMHVGTPVSPDAWEAALAAAPALQPIRAQAGAVPLTDEQITAAAKKLAECMDYPWDHMPGQGRAEMRKHAQAVLAAANGSPPPPPTA